MATSPAFFSSLLNIPNSKIPNSDMGSSKIKISFRKKASFIHFYPIKSSPISISVMDAASSSLGSCDSTSITNSLRLDRDPSYDEELKKDERKIGSKVRVKVPIKVFHAPKLPEFGLMGKIGVLKQYVGIHKGKRISANLPYKVEFVADGVLGRDGNPVKFPAHLKEDEFEFVD